MAYWKTTVGKKMKPFILILLFLSTAAHADTTRIDVGVIVDTPCSMYDGCEVVMDEDGIVNY